MIILVAVLQFYALQKKTDHDSIEQSTQLNPKEKYRFGQGFLCQWTRVNLYPIFWTGGLPVIPWITTLNPFFPINFFILFFCLIIYIYIYIGFWTLVIVWEISHLWTFYFEWLGIWLFRKLIYYQHKPKIKIQLNLYLKESRLDGR